MDAGAAFCINHSWAYGIAMTVATLEYVAELVLLPEGGIAAKQASVVTGLGLVLCIVGLAVRWSAMITAGRHFHHIVQTARPDGHTLVTSGIYAVARHPSYLGWVVWAVGSQVLLGNPVSAVLFVLASKAFFDNRIRLEERHLLRWYGAEYVTYAAKTPTWMPLVGECEELSTAIRARSVR